MQSSQTIDCCCKCRINDNIKCVSNTPNPSVIITCVRLKALYMKCYKNTQNSSVMHYIAHSPLRAHMQVTCTHNTYACTDTHTHSPTHTRKHTHTHIPGDTHNVPLGNTTTTATCNHFTISWYSYCYHHNTIIIVMVLLLLLSLQSCSNHPICRKAHRGCQAPGAKWSGPGCQE